MEISLNKIEKYELLVSTLNMLLVPLKEPNIFYLDSIKNNLEELEGDYYTFLSQGFIEELYQSNIVSENGVHLIEKIRSEIEKISQKKWTVEAFLKDEKWLNVRHYVIEVFSSELK